MTVSIGRIEVAISDASMRRRFYQRDVLLSCCCFHCHFCMQSQRLGSFAVIILSSDIRTVPYIRVAVSLRRPKAQIIEWLYQERRPRKPDGLVDGSTVVSPIPQFLRYLARCFGGGCVLIMTRQRHGISFASCCVSQCRLQT